MGCYIPKVKYIDNSEYVPRLEHAVDIFDTKNTFLLTENDLLNNNFISSKLIGNPIKSEGFVLSKFDELTHFLVGLKGKFDPDMITKPTKTIDERLAAYTNKEIKKYSSLVGQKVIINGPAGSGKSYCIMNNIIETLQKKKIHIIFF